MSKIFNTQAAAILHFYRQLQPDFPTGDGISIMNPYQEAKAWDLASQFYQKFYGDSQPRTYIFGINPGRHGGGVTGIPFTDPIRLADKCGISNDLKRQAELSSQFVYEMVGVYGGVEAFFGHYYITAVSPLGYVRHGRNLNYYDDKALMREVEPFVRECIHRQLETIPTSEVCFCLGEGENYKFFSRINATHGFFKEVIPLPHPRWIMQYRRKMLEDYVDLYVKKLKANMLQQI